MTKIEALELSVQVNAIDRFDYENRNEGLWSPDIRDIWPISMKFNQTS